MKASEIMDLVGEFCLANFELGGIKVAPDARAIELRARIKKLTIQFQSIADEYADLKHCYSTDKIFKITEKIE